jgi:hypothetical protein
VNTTILESDFDARASGTDPPPSSEKERGPSILWPSKSCRRNRVWLQ